MSFDDEEKEVKRQFFIFWVFRDQQPFKYDTIGSVHRDCFSLSVSYIRF